MKGNDEKLLTNLRNRVEYIILCARIDSEYEKSSGGATQDFLNIFAEYLEEKSIDLELPEIPLSERHPGDSNGSETSTRQGTD